MGAFFGNKIKEWNNGWEKKNNPSRAINDIIIPIAGYWCTFHGACNLTVKLFTNHFIIER